MLASFTTSVRTLRTGPTSPSLIRSLSTMTLAGWGRRVLAFAVKCDCAKLIEPRENRTSVPTTVDIVVLIRFNIVLLLKAIRIGTSGISNVRWGVSYDLPANKPRTTRQTDNSEFNPVCLEKTKLGRGKN